MKVKLYLCGGENKRASSLIPLGIGSLISNAPSGTDIEFILESKDLVDCDMIGLSSNAWGLQEAVAILEQTDIPVIIGGQGTLWEGLEELPFRHIVRGEGEIALAKILSGREMAKVIREDEVEDIDWLQPPERGEIRGGVYPIFTSRGCPYHCKFCTAAAQWGKVRWHSTEYIIEDIERGLFDFPDMHRVYILDDLFIANKARFENIHRAWTEHPRISKLGASGFVRANLVTEDVARKLKDIGFKALRFGAESGSDRMLELLGKGTTVADYWRVVEVCKKVGLGCTASFIHHAPGETDEDRRLTHEFIDESGITVMGWYQYAAWPGTAMYDGTSPLVVDMRVRAS